MLVKLGNVWVDPNKVSSLDLVLVKDQAGDLGGMVQIKVDSSYIRTAGDISEFAVIINDALNSQSYGGEETTKKE